MHTCTGSKVLVPHPVVFEEEADLSFISLCSKIVEKIDENHDGFVTVDEMKNWIKHAQKRWIYEDVDRQWQAHDLDSDAHVSWEEYKNATYGYVLGMRESARERHTDMM